MIAVVAAKCMVNDEIACAPIENNSTTEARLSDKQSSEHHELLAASPM